MFACCHHAVLMLMLMYLRGTWGSLWRDWPDTCTTSQHLWAPHDCVWMSSTVWMSGQHLWACL